MICYMAIRITAWFPVASLKVVPLDESGGNWKRGNNFPGKVEPRATDDGHRQRMRDVHLGAKRESMVRGVKEACP
jgi:hypothetical protein